MKREKDGGVRGGGSRWAEEGFMGWLVAGQWFFGMEETRFLVWAANGGSGWRYGERQFRQARETVVLFLFVFFFVFCLVPFP